MAEPGAIQQAVDLLVGRLTEARQRRGELSAEIATIESALTSLSVYSTTTLTIHEGAPEADETAAVRQTSTKSTRSVRSAVKAILDGENRAFTPAEIRGLIAASVMDGKSNEQRTNSVRTALWSLRQKGEARLFDETKTISMKWPEAGADVALELPAENGSGPSASEEAPT